MKTIDWNYEIESEWTPWWREQGNLLVGVYWHIELLRVAFLGKLKMMFRWNDLKDGVTFLVTGFD